MVEWLWESWCDSSVSIVNSLVHILTGDWDKLAEDYDNSALGQAERIGGGTYKATKCCLYTGAAAAGLAAAIGVAEFFLLGNESLMEINILSRGNVFKVVCRPARCGFRIDPAHHGKPWGHAHWWNW